MDAYAASAQVIHRLPKVMAYSREDSGCMNCINSETSPTQNGSHKHKVIQSEYDFQVDSLKTIIVALSKKLSA